MWAKEFQKNKEINTYKKHSVTTAFSITYTRCLRNKNKVTFDVHLLITPIKERNEELSQYV